MVIIKGCGETRDVFINNELLLLEESYKVFKSSPDGFNWGYSGSGPSQLAMAILLKYTSPDKAMSVYIKFRDEVISRLPTRQDFEIQINIEDYLQ